MPARRARRVSSALFGARRQDGGVRRHPSRVAIVCTAAILVVASAGAHGGSRSQESLGGDVAATQTLTVARRSGDAMPAQRPERLRYHATWNAIPVANAELLVQPQREGGRPGSVVLRGRADTNEVLDLLWQMRDSFEATVGESPVAPRRFALHQNENGRRRDTTTAASGTRIVSTVERPRRRARRAEVPLEPRLHDPVSVAYLIRSLPAELDQRPTYHVLAGTKIYDLTIAPTGTELVDAANRMWQARRFHLALQLEPRDVESRTPSAANDAADRDDDDRDRTRWRELKVQEADLWVSTGPERLPLRLTSRTFWGWVTVELVARGGQTSG